MVTVAHRPSQLRLQMMRLLGCHWRVQRCRECKVSDGFIQASLGLTPNLQLPWQFLWGKLGSAMGFWFLEEWLMMFVANASKVHLQLSVFCWNTLPMAAGLGPPKFRPFGCFGRSHTGSSRPHCGPPRRRMCLLGWDYWLLISAGKLTAIPAILIKWIPQIWGFP
jgi:hypothetical protein